MPENQSKEGNPILTKTVAEAFASSDRAANRMILMGAPAWVKGMIHRLHILGVAEVGMWSPILPTRQPGDAIALLVYPRRDNRY